MKDLKKSTERRVAEAARQQRAEKTEGQWVEHLLGIARTQAAILNLLVEREGPDDLEFRVQYRRGDGEWGDVSEGAS